MDSFYNENAKTFQSVYKKCWQQNVYTNRLEGGNYFMSPLYRMLSDLRKPEQAGRSSIVTVLPQDKEALYYMYPFPEYHVLHLQATLYQNETEFFRDLVREVSSLASLIDNSNQISNTYDITTGLQHLSCCFQVLKEAGQAVILHLHDAEVLIGNSEVLNMTDDQRRTERLHVTLYGLMNLSSESNLNFAFVMSTCIIGLENRLERRCLSRVKMYHLCNYLPVWDTKSFFECFWKIISDIQKSVNSTRTWKTFMELLTKFFNRQLCPRCQGGSHVHLSINKNIADGDASSLLFEALAAVVRLQICNLDEEASLSVLEKLESRMKFSSVNRLYSMMDPDMFTTSDIYIFMMKHLNIKTETECSCGWKLKLGLNDTSTKQAGPRTIKRPPAKRSSNNEVAIPRYPSSLQNTEIFLNRFIWPYLKPTHLFILNLLGTSNKMGYATLKMILDGLHKSAYASATYTHKHVLAERLGPFKDPHWVMCLAELYSSCIFENFSVVTSSLGHQGLDEVTLSNMGTGLEIQTSAKKTEKYLQTVHIQKLRDTDGYIVKLDSLHRCLGCIIPIYNKKFT